MTMHQPGRRLSGGQVAVMLLLGLAGSVVVTGLVMAALVTYDPPEEQPSPQVAQTPQPARAARLPGRPALPVVHTPSAAVVPPLPIPPQGHQASARQAPDGHFHFDAAVNGMTLQMVFDTGATTIALRPEDAARAGIAVSSLTYSGRAKTANGIAEFAPVMLESVKVGDVTRYNVPAIVSRPGALFVNLLGQSFMSKLGGYRYQGNELILQGD